MNGTRPEFPVPDFINISSMPDRHTYKFRESLFIDGHVDLPHYMIHHATDSFLSDLEAGPFTLEKAKQSGVRLFGTSLFCEDRFNGDDSYRHFQDILHFTLERFDHVNIIKTSQDLIRVKDDPDQLATFLLIENADPLAGNISYVEQLKDAGIRTAGLTHAGKNRLADGNAVVYSDGISEEGKEVIRALNKNGLIIDVAHLHPKCFWQLLKVFEGTIITSHTGIREVLDIQRNIALNQAREIFARGGVVGITFNPEMLSPDGKGNEEQVFVHLDTLVQKFGPDGVGIGSDFCGFDSVLKGLEDITGINHLIEIMMVHGYGYEGVNKIMGLNWLRIYEKLFK